ncbi:Fc.00g074320.m01.CDS01 [Cosmosporella sp. VM-42]
MAKSYHDPELYEYLLSDTFWILGIVIAINGWWTYHQIQLFVESQHDAISIARTGSNQTSHVELENSLRRGFDNDSDIRLNNEVVDGSNAHFESQKPRENTAERIDNETPPIDEESEEDSAGSAQSLSTPAIPRRPSVFWLQPHITSRSRKALVLVACVIILLLQLLEGYWAFKTAWRITLAALTSMYPHIRPRILGLIIFLPVAAVLLAMWLALLLAGGCVVMPQLLYSLKLWELRLGDPPSLLNQDTEPAVGSGSDTGSKL